MFSQLRPGIKEIATHDNKKAFTDHLIEAKKGNRNSMFLVGEFYYKGIGITQNPSEAFIWFTKAAEAGDFRAWYKLGMLYKYNKGVTGDFKKAYKCFERSAQGGYPLGIYSQGYMHYKGLGCVQDYAIALALFSKASEMNVDDAMYFQGLCYRNGYGTTRDNIQATYWLKRAARKGNKQAVSELMSTTPENSNDNGNIASLINLAEKININKSSSIYKYTDAAHDQSIKENDLLGSYYGYLIKYDWSGNYILSISKLECKFENKQGMISGSWLENGFEPIIISSRLLKTGLEFTNLIYKRNDHYNEAPARTRFDNIKMKIVKTRDTVFLTGLVQAFASERNEPEKPQRIILIKPESKVINATVNSLAAPSIDLNKTSSELTAFPNPFTNVVTLLFSLAKASKIKTEVFDAAGKSVFLIPFSLLPKGQNRVKLKLNVESGVYFVKLSIGESEIKTVKIIKN